MKSKHTINSNRNANLTLDDRVFKAWLTFALYQPNSVLSADEKKQLISEVQQPDQLIFSDQNNPKIKEIKNIVKIYKRTIARWNLLYKMADAAQRCFLDRLLSTLFPQDPDFYRCANEPLNSLNYSKNTLIEWYAVHLNIFNFIRLMNGQTILLNNHLATGKKDKSTFKNLTTEIQHCQNPHSWWQPLKNFWYKIENTITVPLSQDDPEQKIKIAKETWTIEYTPHLRQEHYIRLQIGGSKTDSFYAKDDLRSVYTTKTPRISNHYTCPAQNFFQNWQKMIAPKTFKAKLKNWLFGIDPKLAKFNQSLSKYWAIQEPAYMGAQKRAVNFQKEQCQLSKAQAEFLEKALEQREKQFIKRTETVDLDVFAKEQCQSNKAQAGFLEEALEQRKQQFIKSTGAVGLDLFAINTEYPTAKQKSSSSLKRTLAKQEINNEAQLKELLGMNEKAPRIKKLTPIKANTHPLQKEQKIKPHTKKPITLFALHGKSADTYSKNESTKTKKHPLQVMNHNRYQLMSKTRLNHKPFGEIINNQPLIANPS